MRIITVYRPDPSEWEAGFREEDAMKCHVCGGEMKAMTSDLPFKLAPNRIVILKNLPVLQCGQCGDYLLEDPIMARVEEMLQGVDASIELEVLRYAA